MAALLAQVAALQAGMAALRSETRRDVAALQTQLDHGAAPHERADGGVPRFSEKQLPSGLQGGGDSGLTLAALAAAVPALVDAAAVTHDTGAVDLVPYDWPSWAAVRHAGGMSWLANWWHWSYDCAVVADASAIPADASAVELQIRVGVVRRLFGLGWNKEASIRLHWDDTGRLLQEQKDAAAAGAVPTKGPGGGEGAPVPPPAVHVAPVDAEAPAGTEAAVPVGAAGGDEAPEATHAAAAAGGGPGGSTSDAPVPAPAPAPPVGTDALAGLLPAGSARLGMSTQRFSERTIGVGMHDLVATVWVSVPPGRPLALRAELMNFNGAAVSAFGVSVLRHRRRASWATVTGV